MADRLGNLMVPAQNWHQSLSDRYWAHREADLITRMRRAGGRISAQAVALNFNRIIVTGRHWALMARGRPRRFDELLTAIRTALWCEGIEDLTGHRPHITLSYNAPPHALPPRLDCAVEWVIDEILLVIGGGQPYRYDVLERWPLEPMPRDRQLQLF